MQQPPSPTPSSDSTSSNWPSSPTFPTPLLKSSSRYSHGGPRTGSMGGAGPRVGSLGGAGPRVSSLGGTVPRGSAGGPGPRRSSSGGKGRTCSQKVVALLIAAAVLLGITLGLGLGLGFPQKPSAGKQGKGKYSLDGGLDGSYCTALVGSASTLCEAYLKGTSNTKFAAASAWREESPETCKQGFRV